MINNYQKFKRLVAFIYLKNGQIMAIENKTLYVLGAGFSMGSDAGAPSQEALVGKIFELKDSGIFEVEAIKNFERFLSRSLCIDKGKFAKVTLEDIFSPLDRCIIENCSFRDLDNNEVRRLKSDINYLISKTLDEILKNKEPKYIRDFAKFIVSQASKRKNGKYRGNDPVSVISMNWDILLDNALNKALQSYCNNPKKPSVVDYCCYVSSFEEDNHLIKPGLEALGRGGFNVKLLKLHGSLNWLNCPRCRCLYIGFNKKIGLLEYAEKKPSCRHCSKNYPETNSKLISSLVMPTFLKDLNSSQLKLIWKNAGVEFSEASKIVFIGYSLPSADFELRQLMSRMIRQNVEIHVVDWKQKDSQDAIKENYEYFFGKRKITYNFNGVEDFIDNELK